MAWVETVRGELSARHASGDLEDAERVLDELEEARARLEAVFPVPAGEVAVVLHGSDAALCLAAPQLVAARALTAPAARRYLAGWAGEGALHVLSPPLLARRASSVPGSREMLMLSPAALYAAHVLGRNNAELPPPVTRRTGRTFWRWAWLALGVPQYFSGQTAHLRPAVKRRLHEGPDPAFPPSRRDAALLGGSVIDLLVREEGVAAAVRLARELHPAGAEAGLRRAFRERSPQHTESAWRAHLTRLAAV